MKNTYTHKTLRSICKVSKLKKRSTQNLLNLWERIDSETGQTNRFRSYLIKIEQILADRSVP